jgi:succinyl-CoA synthetase alpha subunit
MRMFNDHPDTEAVIMIGEIGSPDEANAAYWIKDNMKKPVAYFIAGVTAPPDKRMGHAGALISGGADAAQAKLDSWKSAESKPPRIHRKWHARCK